MKKILILLLCLFTIDSFGTGIGANNTTAPCDNATLDNYNGTVNAEINWEPNTIQLGWYDGDTKLNVANVSQSCTYDGMITVPPQPTKPGYTFNGWKVKKIMVPSGYTQLEYITSNGHQIIDTGIYANENTAVEAKFKHHVSSSDSTTRIIIGNLWSNESYSLSTTANSRAYQRIGHLYIKRLNYWETDTLYTVYMDKNIGQVVNGIVTRWDGTPNTFTSSTPLTMFGVTDAPNRGAYATLYYLKIWQNGTLVRDFIPARRNSDNVLGLWDVVSETFFTNSGSGTFAAGPVATEN